MTNTDCVATNIFYYTYLGMRTLVNFYLQNLFFSPASWCRAIHTRGYLAAREPKFYFWALNFVLPGLELQLQTLLGGQLTVSIATLLFGWGLFFYCNIQLRVIMPTCMFQLPAARTFKGERLNVHILKMCFRYCETQIIEHKHLQHVSYNIMV